MSRTRHQTTSSGDRSVPESNGRGGQPARDRAPIPGRRFRREGVCGRGREHRARGSAERIEIRSHHPAIRGKPQIALREDYASLNHGRRACHRGRRRPRVSLGNALDMRVIGVVDLLAGRAVHARAGRRDSYQLVRAIAGLPIESGDALALARAYVDRLGVTELYAADLEAILGGASQDALVAAVAALGAPLWLDAGVSSTQRARHSLGLGAARVVVGLETLASYEAL